MKILCFLACLLLAESYLVKPQTHVALESVSGLKTAHKHRQQLTGYWTGLFDGHAGYALLTTTADGVLSSGVLSIDSARVDDIVVSASGNNLTNFQVYKPQSGALGEYITFDLQDKFSADHVRHFSGIVATISGRQVIHGEFTDTKVGGAVFEWHAILNPAKAFSKTNKVSTNPYPTVSYTALVNGFSALWDGAANWNNNNQLPGTPAQSTEAALLDIKFIERYNGLFLKFFRPATNQTFYGLNTVQGWHGEAVVTPSANNEKHYPWHAQDQNSASYCPDGTTGLVRGDYAVLANGRVAKLTLTWSNNQITGSYYPADAPLPEDLDGTVESLTIQQIADDRGCFALFTRPNGEVWNVLFDKNFQLFHGQSNVPNDDQAYPVDGLQIFSSEV